MRQLVLVVPSSGVAGAEETTAVTRKEKRALVCAVAAVSAKNARDAA